MLQSAGCSADEVRRPRGKRETPPPRGEVHVCAWLIGAAAVMLEVAVRGHAVHSHRCAEANANGN